MNCFQMLLNFNLRRYSMVRLLFHYEYLESRDRLKVRPGGQRRLRHPTYFKPSSLEFKGTL